MSVFSPSTWLSRSRCQSSTSSADFSKDDTATLRGLTYISQHSPSLEPSLEQPESRPEPKLQKNQQARHNNNYEHDLNSGFEHRLAGLAHNTHDHDRDHAHAHRNIMNSPLEQGQGDAHAMPHLSSQEFSPEHQRRCGPKNDQNEINRVLSDQFDDTVSAAEANETEREKSDTFRKDLHLVPEIHHTVGGGTATIQRMPSFGNGSCISGLSADETHYDMDDNKTTKSLDRQARTLTHSPKRNHLNQQQNHSRGFSQGRDFGNVFDHIVEAEDLLTDDRPDHPCNDEVQGVDPFTQMHGQMHGFGLGHERGASTSGGGNNLLLDATSRPRALHNRAQSESTVLRTTQVQSSHNHHQRIPSMNITIAKHPEKSMSLPAHATLRDVIANKRKQAGEHKFISKSSKPQILQVRSTSLTVQSNASTSSIPNSNLSIPNTNTSGPVPIPVPPNGIPVVWSGQQLDNYNFGALSPGRAHNRCWTLGHVNIGSINDLSQRSHSSEYSNGYIPDVPRSHKSTGSAATFFTQSETATIGGSNSNSNQSTHHRQESHVRKISDSELSAAAILSLALPEDGSSISYVGKMEDATTVFSVGSKQSRKSSASRTPKRKGKITLKDEVKFVLGKFVPSPLKKVGRAQNKVRLERSAGCLT